MNEGDLITGVDRSYERSIYKLIKKEPLELEFVSFGGRTLPKGMRETLKPGRKIIGLDFETSSIDPKICNASMVFGETITIDDYRLATDLEVYESGRFGEIPTSNLD